MGFAAGVVEFRRLPMLMGRLNQPELCYTMSSQSLLVAQILVGEIWYFTFRSHLVTLVVQILVSEIVDHLLRVSSAVDFNAGFSGFAHRSTPGLGHLEMEHIGVCVLIVVSEA